MMRIIISEEQLNNLVSLIKEDDTVDSENSKKLFDSIKTIINKKDNFESTATPEDIRTIQFSLNIIDDSNLPINGNLDDQTITSIKKYQEENKLDGTGKLEPNTVGGIISDLLFKITGERFNFGKTNKNFNPMVIQNPGVDVRKFPSDIETKFRRAAGDNYDSFISDVESIGLDPKIAIRQLYTESAFNPDVISCKRTSTAGAKGIAQFMPGTWPTYGGGGNPCNVRDALKAYPKMMKSLLSRFPGRLDLAIAGYNSGPNFKFASGSNKGKMAYDYALKNKIPFTDLKGKIPNESYKYASSILQP
jgi:peptidoglycan hydrolase-like protein with peptidoglycan-binding domain